MHELAVSSAIVDTAIRHADGRRVTAVNAKIGAMRQVVASSLDFYFGIVAKDTLCDEAELNQEPVAAWLRCGACSKEWDPAPPASEDQLILLPMFRCPSCGAADAEVLAGEELEVDSIEVIEKAEV